jgi:hypothetical protein
MATRAGRYNQWDRLRRSGPSSMSTTRTIIFAGLVLLLTCAACSDDSAAPADETIVVDVFFDVNVDGAPLLLNSMIYTNAAGTIYSIKDLRFILSDVRLHTDDGRDVLLKSVHYFDVADPTTQIIHVAGLPHADFTSASFTFGLDESKNVRGKYAALPAIMDWPPGLGPDLGYHYMQLQGNFEQTGGSTAGYTTHTGARQLDGTHPDYPGVVDAAPHHFHFAVNAPFTPAHIHEGGHGELEIHFDLNGWYLDHTPSDGVDTEYDFNTLASQAIMGDLDAQGKLQANGPGCFSVTLAAHDAHH